MVFSSPIFLFIFFPAVFLLYRIVPGIKAKNIFLIITSLVFYSFGQPQYIVLLLASVVINYAAGLLLCREASEKNASFRKCVLAAAVMLNIGILAVFKYLDFAVENINAIFHSSAALPGIILPIGISFYTFQGLSYVIDVYRDNTIGARSFTKLLLYISFFPQLIAGPIVKYHDVAMMIDSRQTSPELTANGLRRFIIGLSKKLLIANAAGAVADSVFALDAGSLDMRIAWIGAICYTLQIYFDFSGYSDMAIGMGRIFGFKFLENFNYPYTALSVQEFWRRWHISLSSWFRDYLYIPLGGSYCGKMKANRNRLIVFFTTGLWHGANWTFVLWGLWHGMFLILENSGIVPVKKMRGSLAGRILGHIYTLLVVILGFTLFRADTLTQAAGMFTAMFGGCAFTPESSQILHELLTHFNIFWICLGIFLSVDLLPRLKKYFGIFDDRLVDDGPGIVRSMDDGSKADACSYMIERSPKSGMAKLLTALSYAGAFAMLIYCILHLSQAGFDPFIYFQF